MGLLRLPSFFGYYNAHRGLLSNQMALETINHNIANVNTEGYSRQRVDLTTGTPYPPATMSNFDDAGQLGQGSRVLGVTRSHDNLLDAQIRTQSNLLEYQTAVSDTLKQVEDVIGEPSEFGIDTAITKFFDAAHTLSLHPDDMAIRTTFIQEANNLLTTFQQKANQLQDIRTSIVGDPLVASTLDMSQSYLTVQEINTLLEDIATLNGQIVQVDGSGAMPNDLLDRRDQLLEELSKRINTTVEYSATGQISVKLGSNLLVQGARLVDTLAIVTNTNTVGPDPVRDDVPALVGLTSSPPTAASNLNGIITGGKLGGLLAVGGNTAGTTTIRSVMEDLDSLFREISTRVNDLQAGFGTGVPPAPYTGVRDLNGNAPVAGVNMQIYYPPPGGFPRLQIFGFTINSTVLNDPARITAAYYDPTIPAPLAGTSSGSDGRNIARMAQLQDTLMGGLGNLTYQEFYKNAITNLGTGTQNAERSAENLQNVVDHLTQRRQSVQGVNLEEEMVDMMRFQRGFEASAKVMATLDEVMKTIINTIA